MPPKKSDKVINANQAKIKYTSICIKKMTESLPRQIFSNHLPVCFKSNKDLIPENINLLSENRDSNKINLKEKKKKSRSSVSMVTTPIISSTDELKPSLDANHNHNFNPHSISSAKEIILNLQLYECLPVHPNISVTCSYCQQIIHSENMNFYIEQPQARRRYTPICNECYNK